MEVNRGGNRGANRDIEVDVGGFLDLLRPDGGADLAALFSRRSRGRRSRGVAGRGAGLAVGSVAFLAPSLLMPLLLCGLRPSCPCRPSTSVFGLHASLDLLVLWVAVLRALAAAVPCRCSPWPSCLGLASFSCRPSTLHAGLHRRRRRCIAPPDVTLHRAAGGRAALRKAARSAAPQGRRRPPAAPPAPCALAKPVPAIRAAAATEIKKRLVI